MIGNDPALDPGVGTCGKNGQGVHSRRGATYHENVGSDGGWNRGVR